MYENYSGKQECTLEVTKLSITNTEMNHRWKFLLTGCGSVESSTMAKFIVILSCYRGGVPQIAPYKVCKVYNKSIIIGKSRWKLRTLECGEFVLLLLGAKRLRLYRVGNFFYGETYNDT